MASEILKALMAARKKRNALTPLSQDAADLCEILDHQLYARDRQHGDLIEDWRKLKAAYEILERRLTAMERKQSGSDPE